MRIWNHGFCPKQPCVYIMASKPNGVLYTGVTSNLAQRVAIHKQDLFEGFTKTYRVHQLVFYEMHGNMSEAILRETRIKKWKRAWKVRLINGMNPEWRDLWDAAWGAIGESPADVQRMRRR